MPPAPPESEQHTPTGGGPQLWFARLDDVADAISELEDRDPLCPPEELQTLVGSRRVARMLLRRLIARTFDAELARRPFRIGAYGKPELPGFTGDFNVSHTAAGVSRHGGDLALIGLGLVTPIGVDLEVRRAVHFDARRRALILDAAMKLAGGTGMPGDDTDRLLQAWARLEAWGKADGRGIGRTLTALRIWGHGTAASPEDAHVFDPHPANSDEQSILAHDVAVAPGLFAAVALPAGITPPPVQHLPCDWVALTRLFEAGGAADDSGVDLAPGAGQKGPHRSVAQPG